MRGICEGSHCIWIIATRLPFSWWLFSSVVYCKLRQENKTLQNSLAERNGVVEERDRIAEERNKLIANVVKLELLGGKQVMFPRDM